MAAKKKTRRGPKIICRPQRVPILSYAYHNRLDELLKFVRIKYLKNGWEIASVFGDCNAGFTAVLQKD